jgi:hypothetical protein
MQQKERTVIQTGISPPPIAAVVVYPLMKLRRVFAPRQVAAITGLAGAMVTKAPIVATLLASNVELITCLPGRIFGLDAMRPESFMKATIEPVNVTPPMRTPRYAVTICKVEMSAMSAITLPILVRTAARPTTECRAATV